MKKQKQTNKTNSKVAPLIVAAAIAAVLLFLLAGPSGDFSPLSGRIARAVAAVEGKPQNPLSEVRQLEMSATGAAQLRKDIANLQLQKSVALENLLFADSFSDAEFQRTRSRYNTRISEKRVALQTKETLIDNAYTRMYSSCGSDTDCLAKVALAHIATLTRRNYTEPSHTELSIANLDCGGGIIEDGLLFSYADSYASARYELASSEASRISRQLQCLSELQSYQMATAYLTAVKEGEARIARNAEARRLFLAASFQLTMLMLDVNKHLNHPIVSYVNGKREDYRQMFAGEAGRRLAKQGVWLSDKQTGRFEQYNLCNDAECRLGLDLVASLNPKNFGFGECSIGEMIKKGPIANVGFACDAIVCEQLDPNLIADINLIPQQIQAAVSGGTPLSQLQRQAASPSQPANPVQARADIRSSQNQRTQFGIDISTAKRDICGKRRAQGREASENEARGGACMNQNSASGSFQCLKNGEQKTYQGIGNSELCKVGAEGDTKPAPETGEAPDRPRNERETRDPQDLPEYSQARELAQQMVQRMTPQIIAEAQELSNAEQRIQQIPVNIEGVLVVHADEHACREGALGCTVPNEDGTITRYAVIEKIVEYASRKGVDAVQMLASVMVHESMHTRAAVASSLMVFDNMGSLVSVNTAIEHLWMRRVDETYFGTGGRTFVTDKGYIRWMGGIRQCPETESCSCSPLQAEVQRIEKCLPFSQHVSQQRSQRLTGREGGPIRDPAGEDIGTTGNGAVSGIESSCFADNRARGVSLSTCAALQCPGSQIAVASKSGGVERCSCKTIGARPLVNANVRLPGSEQCPSGLCPGSS